MLAGGDDDLPWMKLAEGVKVGKTPFELAWGTGIWQYFKDRPDREHIFAQAMVSSPAWDLAMPGFFQTLPGLLSYMTADIDTSSASLPMVVCMCPVSYRFWGLLCICCVL